MIIYSSKLMTRYTRDTQYFCPFAVKATSTTLIFVECITFHTTNIIDDVHKV